MKGDAVVKLLFGDGTNVQCLDLFAGMFKLKYQAMLALPFLLKSEAPLGTL